MHSNDLTFTPLGIVLTDDGKDTLDSFKSVVRLNLFTHQCRFWFATSISDGHSGVTRGLDCCCIDNRRPSIIYG